MLILRIAAIAALALAQTISPPSGNKLWLGIWTQTDSGISEFPSTIANRLTSDPDPVGLPPIYQLGQEVPYPAFNETTGAGGAANVTEIEETYSDALLFLTLYPDSGLDAITDQVLEDLGAQILSYQESLKRGVFIRWAPEMGGNWFAWGAQPTQYLEVWKRMYSTVKRIAPLTQVVWSPNIATGYPSGVTLPADATDAALLDTNGDGNLTAADDAYGPYYPGADYVDWHGVSMYYKGPGFQNINTAQPGGYCNKILVGEDPYYNSSFSAFYSRFCNDSAKPCIISESGAAYHTELDGGEASQASIQQGWWQDCILNTTYLDAHPNIKGIIMFEHVKTEYDGGVTDIRDFRILNNTDTLSSFKKDFQDYKDRFVWANERSVNPNISQFYLPDTTPLPTSGGGSSDQNGGDSNNSDNNNDSSAQRMLTSFLLIGAMVGGAFVVLI